MITKKTLFAFLLGMIVISSILYIYYFSIYPAPGPDEHYVAILEREVRAEDFIDYHDLEDLSFYTYEEAMTSLHTIPEFNELEKSLQCRIALKEVKKQSCKSKVRYLKEITRKNKLGSISISIEGKITVDGPSSAMLKSEVNRLNILVTSLNQQRQAFCDARSTCNPYYIAYFCDNNVDQEIKTTYKTKCEPLLIGEQLRTLEKVLASLDKTINNYNDNKISDDQVKSVVNSEIDQLKSGENSDDKKGDPETDSTVVRNSLE
jgi:hypothetical protein